MSFVGEMLVEEERWVLLAFENQEMLTDGQGGESPCSKDRKRQTTTAPSAFTEEAGVRVLLTR